MISTINGVLPLQDLLPWIDLTLTQIYLMLVALGVAVFAVWLYFQLYVKGVRDTSKRNMIIVSSMALVLFFVGVIGYVLYASLGYKIGFLRGYDALFYFTLLLIAAILCVTVLLMFWNEIRWQRRKRAQIEALRKDSKRLHRDVKQTETREEETDQEFQKIRKEVKDFRDIHDEFKEK